MVFSTPVFLFGFLVLTLGVYYIVPRRFRNPVILFASLIFYFWGEPVYTFIMVFSTLVDYTHGLLVERCKAKGNIRGAKAAVASSVIINLSLLLFFKYWDFIALSLKSAGLDFMPVIGLELPIGISFYTFQTMSYTIDVYRGDASAQHSILNFGTYVTLFPQLIAGPIIKYKDLGEQIDSREYTVGRFADGVIIFLIGLSKKLLIANNVGKLWDYFLSAPTASLSVCGAWLGVIAFTFQIYFDFSGYSDMAIGLGKMLGFEFLPNFNYPYVAKSISDFWKRWHISLTTWFREYLYFPLGGSKCGKLKWLRNFIIVWAATGLWHGASWSFLVWGLYFCVILLAEKLFLGKWLEKLPAAISHIYTLLLIVLGWAIFGIEDFTQLGAYLKVMFGFGGAPLADGVFLYYLRCYLPVLIIADVASTPLLSRLFNRLPENAANVLRPVLVALALFLCTSYVVAGTYNPFLYFRF